MNWTIAPEDLPKHIRLMWHVFVAVILAMFGRAVLHFDVVQTMGYGIVAYTLLNAMSFRIIFTKRSSGSPRRK
jgi:hypothetical protein